MSVESKTPLGAVLDTAQLSKLSQAVSGLSQHQLIWASGYLAGLAHSSDAQASLGNVQSEVDAKPVTVLYGSQTGNAKHLAENYAKTLKDEGVPSNVVSMLDYKPRKIKDESTIVVFVSTHGEGDAPDDAVELHEFLGSKKAPKLPNLKYAVVALGDSSYEFFCQTGKDFDERFKKLGGQSLVERLDCDVDYETPVAEWTKKLTEILKSSTSATSASMTQALVADKSEAAVAYTKQSPYSATLSEVIKITGRDSIKDIRHIEISLEESGISYQPGDALGLWFSNDSVVVNKIIDATKNTPDDEVEIAGEKFTLSDALTHKLELTLSYPGFVKAYEAATNDEKLSALLADRAALRSFLEECQIVDIVEQYPSDIDAQVLVDSLRPITPRLYSIASSQAEVDEEVHLTVAHVAYDAFGFTHQGGASGFLSSRIESDDTINVFIEKNDNFRLPADDDKPIIMVGPGTGIAPFRAFIQERDNREAQGESWLFFGNPHFTQDFLYQTEWQGYLKSGALTKMTLAFSRDQAEKIYVQDRLLEHGKAVFDWLEKGAHFYVCGDANKMAKDVESALLAIIKEYGNKSDADAKAYLVALRKAKRYQKDVY
ncbi:MAG: assimilatory sulfite reductase (NADPH) flavoprotein subunit [Pseudomonadota bacterium]